MDVDCNNKEARATEPAILEIQNEFMERSIVLFRDTIIGDLYGFQRSVLGYSSEISILLGALDPLQSGDAHQRQRVDDRIIRIESKERDRSSSSGLFLKYNNSGLRKEVRGYHVTQTSGAIRRNLGAISEDEYRPQVTYFPSILNPSDTTGRLTEQTEWYLPTDTFVK
ncbi:hypothetical protein AYI68_g1017 [Smittium mucronatum]|uniref:Uncharacterized protein n=1 Tax=Smittium mucronatum TaxID=133383 RepID=A0A1R0H6J0_9FUNG|nr:hypothetical protein AYI68_g1017 [Smittium mucronatum]